MDNGSMHDMIYGLLDRLEEVRDAGKTVDIKNIRELVGESETISDSVIHATINFENRIRYIIRTEKAIREGTASYDNPEKAPDISMRSVLLPKKELDQAGFTEEQAAIAQSVDPECWNAEENEIMNPSPKRPPAEDGPAIFA